MRSDGSLGFGDLSSASVAESVADARHDEAQLLGAFVLLVGEERGGSIARRTLGDDRLLAVLPYLQEAAMAPDVGDALDDADIELDDVRNRLRTLLGAEEQPLIKLRRVTAGSVLNLALLAIAAYTLIAVFGDLDLEELVDELRDASWWWLVFALLLAQLPRVPAAISTMGSIATRCRSGRCSPCSSPSATSTWRSRARRPGWPSTCASSSASACARRRRCRPG